MSEIKRLNDVVSGWATNGGIFQFLAALSVPWKGEVEALPLDLQYHGNHSGGKVISPLVESLLQGDSLTHIEMGKLATVCVSMFGSNWQKLWDTLKFEYDPIENYNMVEEGSDHTIGTTSGTSENKTTGTGVTTSGEDSTRNYTDSNDRTTTEDTTRTTTGSEQVNVTGDSSHEYGETVGVEGTTSEEKDRGVYAFNSADVSPSEKENRSENVGSTTTHGGTDKDTSKGTEERTRNDTETVDMDGTDKSKRTVSDTYDQTASETRETEGTETGSTSGKTDQTTDHRLTRHGNIGVTTSQQMIESERELWVWNYFVQVFADLDKVLTSPIY